MHPARSVCVLFRFLYMLIVSPAVSRWTGEQIHLGMTELRIGGKGIGGESRACWCDVHIHHVNQREHARSMVVNPLIFRFRSRNSLESTTHRLVTEMRLQVPSRLKLGSSLS